MYVSMTGFSRSQTQCKWGAVSVEISSVNHRYQEISVRLPREFASWEPWFHQQLRRVFRRGKVQLRMEVLWAQDYKRGRINRDILRAYCEDIIAVRDELGMRAALNIEGLAGLPGVVDLPSFGEDEENEALETIFADVLKKAAQSWQTMRETEGAHLRCAVLKDLAALEALVSDIEEKWLPTKEAAFQAMRQRVTETLAKLGDSLDESRYMQEVVILSDKWDVSEEIARLKSHITKFRATGEEGESSGRKLDFIIQEMNREVNTLDSKVADAAIRWQAVEAKACLERVREQIQNLE
ncbi:MAG: YicC/YloC family endoribonuclease [Cloacibacillus sp.]